MEIDTTVNKKLFKRQKMPVHMGEGLLEEAMKAANIWPNLKSSDHNSISKINIFEDIVGTPVRKDLIMQDNFRRNKPIVPINFQESRAKMVET